jgi:lysylphosphatidylglycerol synthetase-like protein (DUF2156 family)
MADGDDVVIEHPNRRKATSKLTRLIVIVLLLASAALVLIVTLGGWSALESARLLQIVFILVDVVLAVFVARWSRGVLPMAAALALLMFVFALVAAPSWFDRDKAGFAEPNLPAGLLGVMTLAIIPVQILLIAFAMRGFSQGWNIEMEQLDPDADTGVLAGSA